MRHGGVEAVSRRAAADVRRNHSLRPLHPAATVLQKTQNESRDLV